MNLGIAERGKTVWVMASALLVIVIGSGLAIARQQKEAPPSEKKAQASPTERIAGVILKATPAVTKVSGSSTDKQEAEAKKGEVTLWLSINTNVVWRDWARDQSQASDPGPPKKDAAKGANSVATKGQPVDENSLVLIGIGPETKIETRFRSPADDTTKGVKTPEKVASDDGTTTKKAPATKAVKFRAEDLLPGLYVEVESRHSDAQNKNPASTVTVVRPITVLDTSPTTPNK
jgi:hypothetical protein